MTDTPKLKRCPKCSSAAITVSQWEANRIDFDQMVDGRWRRVWGNSDHTPDRIAFRCRACQHEWTGRGIVYPPGETIGSDDDLHIKAVSAPDESRDRW